MSRGMSDMNEIDRAMCLGSQIDALANYVCDGALSNRANLRREIARVVEQGIALGRDLERHHNEVENP